MYSVLIRPLRIEDASVSYKWRNDPEIWEHTGNRPDRLITEQIETEWLRNKLTETNSARFAILVDNIYVGNIQLTDIVDNRSAEYHIFIGDKAYWGKGVAKLATCQLLRYAFQTLKLKEVYLTVNPANKRAVELYLKSGFEIVDAQAILMRLTYDMFCKPQVSVFFLTYNHGAFVRQALESVLMQKCNFDFEIVVGYDCSTDETRAIIEEYFKIYPGKFNLNLRDVNIGAIQNQIQTLKACSGSFIAVLEGDDYWTSSEKLQKQFEFLQQHTGYSLCFHPCNIVSDSNALIEVTNRVDVGTTYTIEDIITRDWFIMTCSIFFRRESLEYPSWFYSTHNGDYGLQLLLSTKGSFFCLHENMASYRRHLGGVSATLLKMEFGSISLCKLLKAFDKFTENKYHLLISSKIAKLKDRLVEEYVYKILEVRYMSHAYFNSYFRIFKYSSFRNKRHIKYLVRYIFPKFKS